MGQKPPLQFDKVHFGFDKAHLDIEGDVFVKVAGGVVLFRAVGRGNLEHPLHAACHHRFLVELRRLGKAQLSVEVLHLEQLSAAFGSAPHQLAGLDLGKAL